MKNKIIIYILAMFLLVIPVYAASSTWDITFDIELTGNTNQFTTRTTSLATDGLDLGVDLLHPPPSFFQTHVQMHTIADGKPLKIDSRKELEIVTPKTWEITLVAGDPSSKGLSGTNTIKWSNNLPDNVKLTLIDYGRDSTRIIPINEIDIREQSSYSFDVSNAFRQYRFLDLEAELLASSFSIPLNKGWNLVSVPLVLPNPILPAPFESIEGNYSHAFAYIHGGWKSYYAGELPTDKVVNPTRGFWINMTNEDTLEVQGYELIDPEVELTPGWNLLGYPFMGETNSFEIANELNATVIYTYNGSWISYVKDRPFNSLTTLKPGFGYWVKLNP